MLITHANYYQPGLRRRTIGRDLKFGPVSIKFITVALVFVAALFYIVQNMQASAQKYHVMQLSNIRDELQLKTRELEVESARLKSLNTIQENAQNFGLESIQRTN